MTRLGGSRGYAHQIAVRQVKMLGAALSRHTGQEEVEAISSGTSSSGSLLAS